MTGDRSVLLVEDDELQRSAIAHLLGQAGFAVHQAADATSGLERFDQSRPDVVLSDVNLPDGSGIALVHEVRRRAEQVPVVIMTGDPTVETAVQALDLGALRYLVKPLDPSTLVAALEHAVELGQRAATDPRALAVSRQSEKLSAELTRTMAGLWLAYQPIVDARSGEVFGFEALMRSDEPGLPHPGAVLDAAERLGQVQKLGRVVRARASLPWRDGRRGDTLFVNLHPEELADPWLYRAGPLAEIADRVVLEVTERASLGSVSELRERCNELRSMGYRLAVDDIGAGYAGLTTFALLEPELVKIDMALVRDIDSSSTKRRVVRSLTSLCGEMGITVVAEGVETEAERQILLGLGCDLLQGYLIGRPSRDLPPARARPPTAATGDP